MRTSSTQTSKRSGSYLGHGLSVLLVHHRELSVVAIAAATTKRLRNAKEASKLSSVLALLHSRLLSALTQPPPHPARKTFCICIHTLACSRPPRLRAFVGAALSANNKDQFQLSNKCAQDAYLRLVEACPRLLSCSLGAPPQ
jgi:hypothetical protein